MIFECPHCQELIEIIEMNCKIFRHGVFKKNMKQLNPHEKEEECKRVKEKDLIYGCGKPFRINVKDEIEICEYI
jgi:hypothetical protein